MTATTTDLIRLQRELDDLRSETRHNTDLLATAVRRSRLNLAIVAQNEAVRKLRQPTSVLDWHPRPGQPTNPELQNSLLDRLRNGTPVSDTLGNTEPIFGQVNLLNDPTFEGVRSDAAITLTGAIQTISVSSGSGFGTAASWEATQVGATACTFTVRQNPTREFQSLDPFNSSAVALTAVITGAGTHEARIQSAPAFALSSLPPLASVVAAIRVARITANTNTNLTSRNLTIEIYDETDGVVRATTTLDLTALDDTMLDALRTFTSLAWTTITAPQRTHTYRVRYRFVFVTSGTGASLTYHLGEPQLHFAYSPDPVPYGPLLAGWYPNVVSKLDGLTTDAVLSARAFTDTVLRFRIAANGAMIWGSGSASTDLRLSRGGAAILRLDDTATGRATLEAFAGTGPGAAPAGVGRLYYNAATLSWHQVDDTGADSDLLAGGAPASRVSYNVAVIAAADYLARIKLVADTTYRAFLGLTAGDAGSLEFGPGGTAARDTRLYNGPNSGQLILDALGLAFGSRLTIEATAAQRALLDLRVAGDSASRSVLYGDATITGLELGSGAATRDVRIRRSATREVSVDNAAATPVAVKVDGPVFVRGPDSMDLAITYASPGVPSVVTRTDAGLISTTTISYSGSDVSSVVTTRFGKTITVVPTYSGGDITAVSRVVT